MDKNLAYETIKSFVENTDNVIVKDAIIVIHPELNECKDERIRKEIINFLRSPFVTENITDEKIAPWIAYLEKQKEQKDYRKLYKDIVKSEWFKKMYKGKSLGCDEEQKEQKPISQEDFDTAKHEALWGEQKTAEWSKEDEKRLNWVIEHFSQSGELYHNLIVWLKSLRPHPKQEWSEEDERMRQTAIEACKTVADDYENSNARYKCKDWLEYRFKSLRPQPKQEWSEDDKFVFDAACNALEIHGHTKLSKMLKSLKNRGNFTKSNTNSLSWNEEDDAHLKWLCRIIHSQVVNKKLSLAEESELGNWMDKWLNHKPQSHWKPSEEQMEH